MKSRSRSTSSAAAVTTFAVWLDSNVPHFASAIGMPTIQFAREEHRAAYAGAEMKREEVILVPRLTEVPFGEARAVSIVAHIPGKVYSFKTTLSESIAEATTEIETKVSVPEAV